MMTHTEDRKRLRVIVLFGGRSDEHEVSVLSATNVLSAMDRTKYEPVPVHIGRDGRWKLSSIIEGQLSKPTEGPCIAPVPGGRGRLLVVEADTPIAELAPVDAIFPVLHGQWGEDGSIQGSIVTLCVPLIGCGISGSANALDKEITKRLLSEAGLPVARSMVLHRDNPTSFDLVKKGLGLPFFLKPVTQGSSVGVGKVTNDEEFQSVLATGLQHDQRVLAEEYMTGREIECAVLENMDGSLFVSRPGEIVPSATHDFYTSMQNTLIRKGPNYALRPISPTQRKRRSARWPRRRFALSGAMDSLASISS